MLPSEVLEIFEPLHHKILASELLDLCFEPYSLGALHCCFHYGNLLMPLEVQSGILREARAALAG